MFGDGKTITQKQTGIRFFAVCSIVEQHVGLCMEHFLKAHIPNTLVIASLPVIHSVLATECNVMTAGEVSPLVCDHLPDQIETVSLQRTARTPDSALFLPDHNRAETDVSKTRSASIS